MQHLVLQNPPKDSLIGAITLLKTSPTCPKNFWMGQIPRIHHCLTCLTTNKPPATPPIIPPRDHRSTTGTTNQSTTTRPTPAPIASPTVPSFRSEVPRPTPPAMATLPNLELQISLTCYHLYCFTNVEDTLNKTGNNPVTATVETVPSGMQPKNIGAEDMKLSKSQQSPGTRDSP